MVKFVVCLLGLSLLLLMMGTISHYHILMRDVHYVLHAPQGDTYADLLFTMIERLPRRPPVTYTTFQARDLGGDGDGLVGEEGAGDGDGAFGGGASGDWAAAPCAAAPSSMAEREVTVRIESVVQSADRWGADAAG